MVMIYGSNDSIFTINTENTYDSYYNYYCYVSNICGGTYSNSAYLTVNTPVTITQQPTGNTLCAGYEQNFYVSASGTSPINYQWYKNDTIISGASNSSFSIQNSTLSDAGLYTCIISNVCGTITSDTTTLTVIVPPAFTDTIPNKEVCMGDSITFIANASGTNIGYQWSKEGSDIIGATNSQFTIRNSQSSDYDFYSCEISNTCGTASLPQFILTVNLPPNPNNIYVLQTKNVGDSTTYSLSPTGTSPISYQWQKNNVIINGATTNNYQLSTINLTDSGIYKCILSNMCGIDTTLVAHLFVNCPLSITLQPVSVSQCIGDSVNFSITASGILTLNYQWYKNDTIISGATNSQFVIHNSQSSDAGVYSCMVSNSCGLVSSDTASLIVRDYCNISGVLLTSINCGSSPLTNDTLVLKDIYGTINTNIPPAITDNSGNFIFDLSGLHNINNTKYRIELLRSTNIEYTTARTLSDWINLSPLTLRLNKVLWEWTAKYGNIDTISISSAIDLHDNIYVSATSAAGQYGNPFITLIKYGPDGSMKWVVNFADSLDNYYYLSNNMSIDKNCNIYIIGTKEGYNNNGSLQNGIVLKYDSTGNLLWSSNYNITYENNNSNPQAIAIDNSGSVYISGTNYIMDNNYEYLIGYYYTYKFDSTGQQLWFRKFGDATNSGIYFFVSMGIDSLSNVIVSGLVYNTLNDSLSLVSVKYSTNGIPQWEAVHNVGVDYFDFGSPMVEMKVDASGNSYVLSTGETNIVYIINSQIGGSGNKILQKYILLKYNKNGVLQWSQEYNNFLPCTVILDNLKEYLYIWSQICK